MGFDELFLAGGMASMYNWMRKNDARHAR